MVWGVKLASKWIQGMKWTGIERHGHAETSNPLPRVLPKSPALRITHKGYVASSIAVIDASWLLLKNDPQADWQGSGIVRTAATTGTARCTTTHRGLETNHGFQQGI